MSLLWQAGENENPRTSGKEINFFPACWASGLFSFFLAFADQLAQRARMLAVECFKDRVLERALAGIIDHHADPGDGLQHGPIEIRASRTAGPPENILRLYTTLPAWIPSGRLTMSTYKCNLNNGGTAAKLIQSTVEKGHFIFSQLVVEPSSNRCSGARCSPSRLDVSASCQSRQRAPWHLRFRTRI